MRHKTMSQLLVLIVLAVGSSSIMAQIPAVDACLEGVSARPVLDEAQSDRCFKADEALNAASPVQIRAELPTLLKYTHSGNEIRTRGYATMFLMVIAMRPDGADLLSSAADEISSLIVDSNSGLQKVAVVITDWVISKPQTNKQPYLAALLTGIQNQQTPQNVVVEMIAPLLSYNPGDPSSVKSVLLFLHRSDLTESTRIDIVHDLADERSFPREVREALVDRLDDPSLRVRAAAVIAFSNQLLGYDPLARNRVEAIAKDRKENPRLRALAKEALAGHAGLNPNIDLTPYKPIGRNY